MASVLISIESYDIVSEADYVLTYVVMCAIYKGKWVFVRHKNRETWEVPGGHIELGETTDEAAGRELYEEAGATKYELQVACDYSVGRQTERDYGRLYFAQIEELNDNHEFEIQEVIFQDTLPNELTYAEIQP